MHFTLSNYRHVVTGIVRQHVKPIATPFHLHDEALGSGDLGVVFSWQTSHRPRQGAGTYGLNAAFPTTLQPELLNAYRDVSTLWQVWLGVIPPSAPAIPRWRQLFQQERQHAETQEAQRHEAQRHEARRDKAESQETQPTSSEPTSAHEGISRKRKRPNPKLSLSAYNPDSDSDKETLVRACRQRCDSTESEPAILISTLPTLIEYDALHDLHEDNVDMLQDSDSLTSDDLVDAEAAVGNISDSGDITEEEEEQEEEVYLVKCIKKKMRDRAGKIKYLVEWEGYPHTADYTWEPEQQLREDVPHIVMAWDRA
jgi:hypothetical protein